LVPFEKKSTSKKDTIDFVHLNTHLDVWSQEARVEQAKMVLRAATDWQARYPLATIIVTGDFNAANGHKPHQILLSNDYTSNEGLTLSSNLILRDSWEDCHSRIDCTSHDFSSTFHGWLGSHVDLYGARMIHFILQTIHGSGIQLPRAVRLPNLEEIKILLSGLLDISAVLGGLPESLSRLHVDWILVSKTASVRMIYVAEIRDKEFSSDHFPVVALLEHRQKSK